MDNLARTFQKEFEVYYYEVNTKQELTLVALLNYLEETAIAHSESVGYGVNRLIEMGFGWVLVHWQVKFKRFPKRGEKVTIQTWPSEFNRFYGKREFLVRDSEGGSIAEVSSLWIFMNLKKRRPVRIPKEVIEAYVFKSEKVISEPFPELVFTESSPGEQCEFLVRRGDIDTNAHVNNAKYIEWLLETIPQEIYESYQIFSLEVVYKKESTYGQSILARTAEQEKDDKSSSFLHQISGADGEQEFAVARSRWVRIDNLTNE
ncbi:acyl-[acyl-carrier-protein] thioesterase [Desulfitobacterium sp. Sab5]|uniref:acyl-[acyl-carrier-protein] thioesterase n=1 Tax=Desulfitobacterium nosdiversum TaxID=3375356 RepID=UPI003CEA5084